MTNISKLLHCSHHFWCLTTLPDLIKHLHCQYIKSCSQALLLTSNWKMHVVYSNQFITWLAIIGINSTVLMYACMWATAGHFNISYWLCKHCMHVSDKIYKAKHFSTHLHVCADYYCYHNIVTNAVIATYTTGHLTPSSQFHINVVLGNSWKISLILYRIYHEIKLLYNRYGCSSTKWNINLFLYH